MAHFPSPFIARLLLVGFFFLFTVIIVIFDLKYAKALRDDSAAGKEAPYSFSRVQMSFWTIIIFSCYAAAAFTNLEFPNLDPSLLYLLGLSGGTSMISKLIDAKSDMATSNVTSSGFFDDILNKGDIHRYQAMIINAIVGILFIIKVLKNINIPLSDKFTIDMILPAIPQYVLVLLSVSSAVYLGLKTKE